MSKINMPTTTLSDEDCNILFQSVTEKLHIENPKFFYPIYKKVLDDENMSAEELRGVVFDIKFKCKQILCKLFDSDSEEFANWTSYEYDDQPVKSIFYHFSGITPYGKDGYALSAWVVDPSGSGFGARTIVKRNKKGEFKKGKFTRWTYPGSILTTSDSVWQNWIIGVFNTKDNTTIHGYVLRIT